MANTKNLIPFKAGADAKERGRKGGRKSGESRRQKASMRAAFQLLANLPCSDDVKETLLRAGLPENDVNNAAALALAAFQSALGGNVQSMRLCLEMLGEDPTIQIKERSMELKESAVGMIDRDCTITVNLLDDVTA